MRRCRIAVGRPATTGLIALAFVATLILLARTRSSSSAARAPIELGRRLSRADCGASETPAASAGVAWSSRLSRKSAGAAGHAAGADAKPMTRSSSAPATSATATRDNDEATAALLDDIPGTVFTLGDNAYPRRNRAAQFEDCYDPTWGRHKQRTRPIPGNHDYHTKGASAYLDYFGKAAVNADGDPWYSYDLGEWHIIALDSECEETNDCVPDSKQGRWLTADLAASDAMCTMAMWHVPRFSSGFHQNDNDLDDFWRILYDAGADVIVNGHDHDYERFAPQDPDAVEDRPAGIREFVVGTGGTTLRPFEEHCRQQRAAGGPACTAS